MPSSSKAALATEDKQKALDLIRANPANHQRFFGKLQDASWLGELRDAEFFSQPPAREEEEDWVRFPAWAESEYLVRVVGQAPELVAEIAAAIPATNNVRVHADVLRVAVQVPGPQAAQLAAKETEFLRDYIGPMLNLADAIDALVPHLIAEDEPKAAFGLLRAALAIERDPNPQSGSRKKARGKIDEWQYGRTLKRVRPTLLGADAPKAFSFLCDRLKEVIEVGFASDSGHSLAGAWRSAIEDHSQNLGHSLLDTLVEAVRDAAVELAEMGELELVLLVLGKYEDLLFRRIALHLLRLHGSSEQITEVLLDRDVNDDRATWHEYALLLGERFATLQPEQREAIVAQIMAGPQAKGVSEEAARYWRFRRLNLIGANPDGDAAAYLAGLREEFQEPDQETFTSYSRSWTGPVSPFTEAQLKEWGPERVAEQLRGWQAADGFEEPTPEGLGRILESVVSQDPVSYAKAASLFEGLAPTYVRALLGGLANAAKEGSAFEWEPAIALCESVIAQPRSAEDSGGDIDGDPHWGWARKQMAGLLSQGFEEGSAELPLELRERSWALLGQLAEDPDPDPSRETYGEHSMDPGTLAINTVRGETIHAVFRYLLWVERGLGEDFTGPDSAPEAAELLDRHLDPAFDPSLAIRAAYGQWFPQVVRINKGWAEQLAPLVFPTDSQQEEFFDAAWSTYIVFTNPYFDVLAILTDAYSKAIDRIGVASRWSSFAGDPAESLGDHLMFFVAFSELGLEDGNLFPRFWGKAQEEAKERVITQTGWSLEHRSEPLSEDASASLRATWEWILAAADGPEKHLSAFGSWLGAGVLDPGWRLEKAIGVLRRGIHLDPNFVVFGALPSLAAEHPLEAVEVVELMAKTDGEGWAISGSEEEVRKVLTIALKTGGEAARRARTLIDLLGAEGMVSFGELLE